MVYAVVRVRGRTGIRPEVRRTLELLNLTRVNHCVVIPENPNYKGMLQKAKDYIAWGEVKDDVLKKMLLKRARISGNKRLGDDFLKSIDGGLDGLVKSYLNGKMPEGIKKVFRLHPPRGGYKSIKRPYPRGALGYHGDAINNLLERMI